MARWVCVFEDGPELLIIREQRRALHHEFLRRNASRIRRAGALCPPGSPPTGALWLLDVENRDEAVALIEQDPYFDARYRRYQLYEWKWALDYPID
jgi:uncharacterized protein YciI